MKKRNRGGRRWKELSSREQFAKVDHSDITRIVHFNLSTLINASTMLLHSHSHLYNAVRLASIALIAAVSAANIFHERTLGISVNQHRHTYDGECCAPMLCASAQLP